MRFSLSLLLLGALSCATDAGPPQVGFAVSALGEPGLPEDVECISITVLVDGEGSPYGRAVSGFPDDNMNGRPELVIETTRLPEYGTPFSIELAGSSDCGSEAVQYIGSTGLVTLRPGERRILSLALYQVNQVEPLARGSAPSPRFLHTATALPDGRVLISGGFDTLTQTTSDCPTDSNCYDVTAADDAWIFDPPSGRFIPVEGGMMEARAGHSAHLLPDGRVAVIGGASSARLTVGNPSMEFQLDFTTTTGLASFEYFDPALGAEIEDFDSDGDPGAGRFAGSDADPSVVGRLNDPRFLHAHAMTEDGKVLLAGGSGGDGAEFRFELFDGDKPGGGGVYANEGRFLSTPRRSPAAMRIGEQIWIVGGADAMSDADLVEVWTSGGDESGSTSPGTDNGFPGGDVERPEFALRYPTVATNEAHTAGAVIGWYGPLCEMGLPSYEGTQRCEASGGPERNFMIDEDGRAISFALGASGLRASFGAVAEYFGGQPVHTGGTLDTRSLTGLDELQIETAGTAPFPGINLQAPRLFHRATPIDKGMLITGGLRLTVAGGSAPLMALVTSPPGAYHGL